MPDTKYPITYSSGTMGAIQLLKKESEIKEYLFQHGGLFLLNIS